MAEPDLLFTVRNAFYLGAFQSAIAEASDLEGLSDQEKVERDCYVYRSYIELGSYELVINEVSESSAQALQAVKLLAQYLGDRVDKEKAVSTVAEWIADPACAGNAMTLLVAGMIYANEGNYVEALKSCHTGLNLEMMALSVQVYLQIDRPDQAEKQLKAMSALDDDATLTQLATAWVDLFLGGAKVQEATVIFAELGDKFGWSVRLYNGAAACAMRAGEWEDAERLLNDAYAKDPKSADALANLAAVGLHLGKATVSRTLGRGPAPALRHVLCHGAGGAEVWQGVVSQLKTVAPAHPVVRRGAAAEEAFDRAANSFVAA